MAKIILLEDDFILANDYTEVLQLKGHFVETTTSATEAFECCRAKSFDLAIVDVFILNNGTFVPDGGISFISKLRLNVSPGLETNIRIPIIAISGGVSAKTDYGPLQSAMEIGATYTLRKPFDDLELLLLVETALAKN